MDPGDNTTGDRGLCGGDSGSDGGVGSCTRGDITVGECTGESLNDEERFWGDESWEAKDGVSAPRTNDSGSTYGAGGALATETDLFEGEAISGTIGT